MKDMSDKDQLQWARDNLGLPVFMLASAFSIPPSAALLERYGDTEGLMGVVVGFRSITVSLKLHPITIGLRSALGFAMRDHPSNFALGGFDYGLMVRINNIHPDFVTASKKFSTSIYPHTCPTCKGPALMLFTTIECERRCQ